MTPIKLLTPVTSLEAGKFRIISVFLGSGRIPFCDTKCPNTLTLGNANLHLSKLNFRFVFCNFSNTSLKSCKCCFNEGLNMVYHLYKPPHILAVNYKASDPLTFETPLRKSSYPLAKPFIKKGPLGT